MTSSIARPSFSGSPSSTERRTALAVKALARRTDSAKSTPFTASARITEANTSPVPLRSPPIFRSAQRTGARPET